MLTGHAGFNDTESRHRSAVRSFRRTSILPALVLCYLNSARRNAILLGNTIPEPSIFAKTLTCLFPSIYPLHLRDKLLTHFCYLGIIYRSHYTLIGGSLSCRNRRKRWNRITSVKRLIWRSLKLKSNSAKVPSCVWTARQYKMSQQSRRDR